MWTHNLIILLFGFGSTNIVINLYLMVLKNYIAIFSTYNNFLAPPLLMLIGSRLLVGSEIVYFRNEWDTKKRKNFMTICESCDNLWQLVKVTYTLGKSTTKFHNLYYVWGTISFSDPCVKIEVIN